ncbi:hypothetical protein THAOC_22402, partial [Thalassiosira oceanica]
QKARDGIPEPFLPHLAPYPSYKPTRPNYGLKRIDHTVGNVPNLLETQNYIQTFTGYHPFAEFTPEDIGTVDSGLNSVVLASDSEAVLLPLNEPTEGQEEEPDTDVSGAERGTGTSITYQQPVLTEGASVPDDNDNEVLTEVLENLAYLQQRQDQPPRVA